MGIKVHSWLQIKLACFDNSNDCVYEDFYQLWEMDHVFVSIPVYLATNSSFV